MSAIRHKSGPHDSEPPIKALGRAPLLWVEMNRIMPSVIFRASPKDCSPSQNGCQTVSLASSFESAVVVKAERESGGAESPDRENVTHDDHDLGSSVAVRFPFVSSLEESNSPKCFLF